MALLPCCYRLADNPVTDDTLHDWSGFVSMIVDSYLNRQMSW
jgi:hypothetical protein